MAYINPFIKVNAGGIPRLQAETATVSGNDVTFDFRPHRFLNYPYAGLIIFKLPSYTVTSAGNVYFTTEKANKVQVYDYAGTALDSSEAGLKSGGIYIGWYENGKVQILTVIS